MLNAIKNIIQLPKEITRLFDEISQTTEKTVASLQDNGSFRNSTMLDFIQGKVHH